MLCWSALTYERHLLVLIRRALLSNRGTVICFHTNVAHKANAVERKSEENKHELENAKLDAFVRSLQLKNKTALTTRKVAQKSGVRGVVVFKKHVGNISITETSKSKVPLPENNRPVKESHLTVLQNLDAAQRNIGNDGNELISSSVKCLNSTDVDGHNGKENVNIVTKGSLSSRLICDSECVTQHHLEVAPNHVPTQVEKSTVTSVVKATKGSSSPLSHQFNNLTKAEQSTLTQLMDDGKLADAVMSVENHYSNNLYIPFGVLRRLCGSTCVLGQVDIILRMKTIAEKSQQHLYKKEFHFDTYLASALCYSGNYQASLDKMTDIYKRSPKGSKKVRDTVKHIIYHIMKTNKEDHEEIVLKFVTQLAKELHVLSPSLSLWRFCFCSDVYRHQKIADNLLENHPDLVELLPQKIDNIIRLAYDNGDLDLLHRIFQLLLFHKLGYYYTAATTALLKHQCEIGDVKGADETIKFATILKVQLKSSDIQRFLAILHQHNRPAPLSILEMKYRLPPKPSPVAPPRFVYRF